MASYRDVAEKLASTCDFRDAVKSLIGEYHAKIRAPEAERHRSPDEYAQAIGNLERQLRAAEKDILELEQLKLRFS